MFNIEIKERFINDLYYNKSTQRTVRHTFEKIGVLEDQFNKDLYSFNQQELGDMLRFMDSPTVNALGRYLGFAKQYVKWATENGYCSPNMAFMNIFRKDLPNYINKDAASNQYIKDRDELYILCNKLANHVDRALLVLFYEGLNGSDMEEVRFLEKQDIKFISNTIQVRVGDNPRNISNVDERSMNILQETIEQNIYYNDNGRSQAKAPTRKLMNSPYVIRQVKMHNTEGDAISVAGINVKLDKIKKWLSKYYLNSTNIFYSGMFNKLENIEKENGELVAQNYRDVLKISGMNPETWGLLKENYLVYKANK